MTRSKRLSPLLAVLVLSVALAACGSDSEGGGSSSSSPTPKSGGSDTVDVSMGEFAFNVSGKLTAGGRIQLSNKGEEMHMMGVVKLKDGVTVAKVKETLAKADPSGQEDPLKALTDGEVGWPGSIVTPGHELTISAANLEPGRYGLICYLPSEGKGTPHFAQGMVGELEVVAGKAVPAPKPDATYKLTVGKPLEGPGTLKAGRRTIEITGDGDVSKQEPQLVMPQSADQTPDQLDAVINEVFGGFESGSGPAVGTGKKGASLLAFAGFDFGGGVGTVRFTYDFEPGTYYLAAPDTDVEGPDRAPVEIVKITVT